MSELRLSARCDVHEGKLDEFRAVAAACLESVKQKDTGTLQYEWFFDDDHERCVILERYRDSEALLEHVANLGETFGALLSTCDFRVDLFGDPSEELLEATRPIRKRIYRRFQGIQAVRPEDEERPGPDRSLSPRGRSG